MIDPLRLLMSRQLKHFKLAQKTSGFTLIELLVAMIMAFLIIGPLMGFMINTLNTDRQEQAKATSEQEIQSALDFIAQDLDQAVYIYDADGLNNKSTDNPPGIKDQILPVATSTNSNCVNNSSNTCVPILAFWKREFNQGILPASTTSNCTSNSSNCNDTFVYSLVVYYFIQGNNANGTWSNAARIGRFEIRDGVVDPNNPTNTNGTPKYIQNPSPGFKLFDLTLSGQALKDKMDSWLRDSSQNYTDYPFILVDYIDQNLLDSGTQASLKANCPAPQLVTANFVAGFYACVNSSKTSAQLYIRGNALARIQNANTYNSSQSIYFPTASIQIKGRGFLSTN